MHSPNLDYYYCFTRKTAKSKTEKWLVRALAKSEFKRWQAPPVLKVSDHAFGRGRRMPIAGNFEG